VADSTPVMTLAIAVRYISFSSSTVNASVRPETGVDTNTWSTQPADRQGEEGFREELAKDRLLICRSPAGYTRSDTSLTRSRDDNSSEESTSNGNSIAVYYPTSQ
jgi:hypothetical protein